MLRFTAFLNEAAKGEEWHHAHPVSHLNIIDHFKQATTTELHQGLTWYKRAHRAAEEIAKDTGHSITTVAGLISNYSPQTEWNTNLHIAARVAKSKVGIGGKTQEPYEGKKIMAPDVRRKAADEILSGKHYSTILKGNKVQHFAHLIEYGGDKDPKHPKVAVDRHAWSVAAGARMPDSAFKVPGNKLYNHVAGAYIHAARHINKEARERGDSFRIEPHQLQAVTWLVRQRKNNEEDRASAVRTMAKGNSWLPGMEPTAKDLPKSFATDKTRVGASQRWVGYAKQHHAKIAGLFEEAKMAPWQKRIVDLLHEVAKIAKEHNLGDILTYGRCREFDMSVALGHEVGQGWMGGADGYDQDGNPVEYKATITDRINGPYNGISWQPTIKDEEAYINYRKIGGDVAHYISRYDEYFNIVEMYVLTGKQAAELIWPKVKQKFLHDRAKGAKVKADSRLGVSISQSELEQYGTKMEKDKTGHWNPVKKIPHYEIDLSKLDNEIIAGYYTNHPMKDSKFYKRIKAETSKRLKGKSATEMQTALDKVEKSAQKSLKKKGDAAFAKGLRQAATGILKVAAKSQEKGKHSSKDTVKKAVQTKTISLETKPETTTKNGHPAGIPFGLIGKKVHLQTGKVSEPKSPGVIKGMVSALKNAVVGKRKEQEHTQIGADRTQKGEVDLDKLDNIQLGQIAGERGGQHKEKAIKILQQRKKEGKYHGKIAA